MIEIEREIVEKIFKHGKQEVPIEACGYLAGKNGRITKYFPMTNIDKSEHHFTLDPKEQFAVIKETKADGLTIIAVSHTHPTAPAKPSKEDIKLAYDPNVVYIIASLMNTQDSINAFRIRKGVAEKERLEII